MGINGINPYNFTSSMRINDIPRVDAGELSQKNDASVKETQKPEVSIEPLQDNRPKSIDPNSISLTANKQESFDYIGSEKDIHRLDMEKAISQMQQDTVLQGYNYFVGNASNVYNSEDGMVISKF